MDAFVKEEMVRAEVERRVKSDKNKKDGDVGVRGTEDTADDN
jgi:hypothetical protein